MGLEKHPVLVSVLVSKKLSGLGLEACGLDYNTGKGAAVCVHVLLGTKLANSRTSQRQDSLNIAWLIVCIFNYSCMFLQLHF